MTEVARCWQKRQFDGEDDGSEVWEAFFSLKIRNWYWVSSSSDSSDSESF